MFLLLMTQIIDELRYNNGISKIANLLDNTSNQSSKFRTKNWFEVNDDSRRTHQAGNRL